MLPEFHTGICDADSGGFLFDLECLSDDFICQFDEKENITIVLSTVVDDSFCLLFFAEG